MKASVSISFLALATLVSWCLSSVQQQVEARAVEHRSDSGTPLARYRREAATGAKKRSKPFEQECLISHNKWRRLHRAGELVFDAKIAEFAQKRADHIAASDGSEFKHPDNLPYGENLAWHSQAKRSCGDLVKMWYDEVNLYDWNRAQFSHETGHFTQLVWKDTTRVGCARAFSSGPKGGVYLVCNYDPAGNYLGENEQNVLRRKDEAPSSVAKPTTPKTTITTTTAATTTATTTTTARPSTSTALAPSSTETSSREPKKEVNKGKKKGKKKKGKKKGKNKKGKRNKKSKKRNKSKNAKNDKIIESTTAAATTVSLPTPPSPVANPTG